MKRTQKAIHMVLLAFLTVLISTTMILAAVGHYTSAQVPGSWVLSGDNYYWKKNSGGNLTNAFLEYKDNTYYLNENGVMAQGWKKVDGKWYYFRNWGGMYKNTFLNYDNNTYYLDASGVMAVGWKKVNENWYYFRDWGGMYKSTFLNYDNNTYYLDANGIMAIGWKKINGNWYYFRDWGGMYKSTFLNYDNNTYYVDASGIMATEWKKINNTWYYFKSWGGMCKNEMITYNGYNYYLKSDGSMAIDRYTVNGTLYYFLPSGERAKLQKVNSKRRLAFNDSNGVISTVTFWGIIEEYVATNGQEWKTGDRTGYAYYTTAGTALFKVQAWQPRHYNASNQLIKTFGWSKIDSMYSPSWNSMFASRNLTGVTYGISAKNDSRIIFTAGSPDLNQGTRATSVKVNLYY